MYANDYMKNDTNIERPAARAWQWFTCNELAYWQVAPGKTTLRSPNVTKEMFYQQCKDIFDENMPRPDVDAFNAKWGGLQQNGTKIFYTTGSQDPWTHLCITEESVPDGCYARTIVGPNNGHCRDLHGETPADSKDLKETRLAIRAAFKKWLMID
jgi:serine protease 16